MLVILGLLTGCEKNIEFKLDEAAEVLVVDASIENNQPPYVVLTRSTGYFNAIDTSLMQNLFVHQASVTISNGTVTQQLHEIAIPTGQGFSLYAYTIDPLSSNAFLGELNRQYSLQIVSEGKTYTANTTIPTLAKHIDSVWWKPAPFQTDDPRKVVLMIQATDPAGLGNYIRYFTRVNRGNFLPGENSVFDDQVIDGTTYSLQLDPGIDRNNKLPFDSNYFKRGDTVVFKLCNIDRSTYRFWNTWEFAAQSIGNPFAQPGKVIGNISNGALGAFYGYGAEFRTVVIPR